MSGTDGQGGKPFWGTFPGILTALAAVITAVGGVVAVMQSRPGAMATQAPVPAPVPRESGIAVAPSPGQPPPLGGGSADAGAAENACFQGFLGDLGEARVFTLADGAQDVALVGPSETKRGVFGLRLVSGGAPVAGLRFTFSTSDEHFRIEGARDALCGAPELANASRGGDPRVLVNWDELRIRTASGTYLLRLGYGGGEIGVNYFRRIVE